MFIRFVSRLALVLPLVLAACSSTHDEGAATDSTNGDAIVHGKADPNDLAVVALSLDGTALCTGSLIGPRAVLTARHCVSNTSEEVSCASSSKQIQGDRDPSTITVYVGQDIQTAKPVAQGVSLFVPATDRLCDHDIAIVILDQDVTSVKPLEVELSAPIASGEEIRAVGFGLHNQSSGAGAKATRSHVAIEAFSTAEFQVGESTCSGDSGGPAISETTGKIVGVVSRGTGDCVGSGAHNLYTRTDAFDYLVKRALSSTSGSQGAGGASSSDEACGIHHHCPKGSHCDTTTRMCVPTP